MQQIKTVSFSAFLALMASLVIITACQAQSNGRQNGQLGWERSHGGGHAKYIFYFIGDGMASVQVHAAEAYLASLMEGDEVPGSEKAELLTMSRFPVQGMSTTFANNRLIT